MCLRRVSKHQFDTNVQVVGIEFMRVKIKLFDKNTRKHTRYDVVRVVILESIEHVLTGPLFLQSSGRSKNNHANAFITV